jgi:polar amino acid transport system substrate-binding protein
MQSIAEQYGVQDALVEQGSATYEASAEDSDVEAIQEKGTLIVGITDFEPMDYKDDSGEWIGFDADMARVVGEKLGVEVQFVEIDWDTKTMELDSGNIDVVWNGMTLTDEVTASMECTNAYCNNAQVVVEPK